MQMSSATALAKQNNEFIIYRLNAIERRIDHIETALHHSHQDQPDLVKLVVELMKGQVQASQPHTTHQDSYNSPIKPSDDKEKEKLESFHMSRRRSII